MEIHIQIILRLAISFIVVAAALPDPNERSDAVCHQVVSSWKSRNVSYEVSYRKGWWIFASTKFKTEYKTEYYRNWEKVCCTGYENEGGKCKPKCSSNCENGYCALPNICKCNVGYEMSVSESPNVCVLSLQ